MFGSGNGQGGSGFEGPHRPRQSACRLNHTNLPRNVGREVRLLGEVRKTVPPSGTSEGSIIIAAPDGHEVTCVLHQSPPHCKYVEVFAKVQPNLSLKQSGPLIEMGDNVDMKMFYEAICLTEHPQLREHFHLDET